MDFTPNANRLTFGPKPWARASSILLRLLKSVSLEPAVFFYTMSYALMYVEVANLYIEKTCKVGSAWFGNRTFPDEVCDNIYSGAYPEEQAEVQRTVAKVEMVGQFLRGVPPLFFSLLLGPWSDRFGRKFLMNISTLAYVVGMCVLTVNVYFFRQLKAEFLLLESISALGGLYNSFFLGAYGHVSDTSSERYRTLRIVMLDAVFSLSFSLGNLVNGRVFDALGYYGSFGSAAACWLVVFLYVTFVVRPPEKFTGTAGGAGEKAGGASSYLSIVSWRNLKESFAVFTRRRRNGLRHIINLLLICYGVATLTFSGAGSLEYLYIRKQFSWPEAADDPNFASTWYTQYTSYVNMASLVISFVLLPVLTNVLGMPDVGIAMLSSAFYMAYCLIYAFSADRNQLYIAIPVVAASYFETGPLRSVLSKLAGPEDVGKAFAGCGALQALAALTAPLYNLLYVNTMSIFLGFYLLVTTAVSLVQFLVMLYVLVYLSRVERRGGLPKKEEDKSFVPKFSYNDDLTSGRTEVDNISVIYQPS